MRGVLALLVLLFAAPLWAGVPVQSLRLLAEYPVQGMPLGNLSGLARCGGELLTVSDREDDRLYRLIPEGGLLRAEAQFFKAPPAPSSGLSWGARARAWTIGLLRGNALDFEGISCDGTGNLYLVSETYSAVLRVPLAGEAGWLQLPDNLVRQARASGMLLRFNGMFEGITIDPKAERLWLAAERERRGLMVLHRQQSTWRCVGGCVMLSEAGTQQPIAAPDNGQELPLDFSDLVFHKGKLFTLERLAHQICRRKPDNGAVERCWSFAKEALVDGRRYGTAFGVAEGLWLDADSAWLGLDSGDKVRADGERRPIVWRFATPKEGWSAK